jgi:hypothetical protein
VSLLRGRAAIEATVLTLRVTPSGTALFVPTAGEVTFARDNEGQAIGTVALQGLKMTGWRR